MKAGLSAACLPLALFLNMPAAYSQQVRPPAELVQRMPLNPSLPTIFLAGDSTADFHNDVEHQGAASVQGWGTFLEAFFDPQKVNVVNAARAGKSSRTYRTGGYWDGVLKVLKPGDIVLIQLGQNDVFPINDSTRARGTLHGTGDETQEIENEVTHQREVVHTYGWYLRQYIRDTKAKGATPVVLSLTPRNVWKNGQVEVGVDDYRMWARTVALEEHNTDFVDVSGIIAREYQKLGQQKVVGLYHDNEPVHMTTPGAYLAAQLTVSGLKSLLDEPVTRFLSHLGETIVPADELAFDWPAHNSAVPTLWVLGDSTVRNGDGTGMGGMWGWGDELQEHFDPARLHVANVAVSGRSSRTYYTKDWPYILPNLRPGDFVLMQFGHNDLGDPAERSRMRASLPGIGEEERRLHNPQTDADETIHTYGWYLRQMIEEARKAGATPIVCSPIPRNQWQGDTLRRELPVQWSQDVAQQEGAPFVDLNLRIAHMYEALGKQKTTTLFADGGTHTTLEGAQMNADAVMQELKSANVTTLLERAR
jgi:lysophospholipase L1-like esterase